MSSVAVVQLAKRFGDAIALHPTTLEIQTAQQLGYFQVNDVSNARITQQVASASVWGDFGQFFRLPGGPVQFSFGGEYRKEASRFIAAGRYIRTDALWQHDVQAQYQLSNGFAFYGGITNLTDQHPDPSSYSTNTPVSPPGRFLYVGAKINLGR